MDQVPFNPSVVAITGGTIVGVTLSGSTILASTLSGNTILNSTSSGGTHVGGTFSGNTFINPTISGGTMVGTAISGSTITVQDGSLTVIGSADATKTLKFEVDAQSAGIDLVIDTGAQTVDRTVTFPVLAGAANIVVREAALTDNAAVRADGTTGKVQDSAVIIDDSNNVTGVVGLTTTGAVVAGTTLTATTTFKSGATALDADFTGEFGTPYVASIGSNNSAYSFVGLANQNTSVGAWVIGAHTRSTGTDANTIVQSGDELAHFGAFGADGAAYRQAGYFAFEVDGTPGSADMPGRCKLFLTPDGSATPGLVCTWNNAGDLAMAAGNTITVPGGIIFANETLANYDEGTWTPTIFGDSVGGSPTYSNQVGLFTRVGRLVYAVFRVTISAKNTTAGNIGVGGLPFTANATAAASAAFSYLDGATFPAGRTHIGGYQQPSTTYITLYFSGSGVAPSRIDAANVTDALDIIGSVIYGV